MKRTIETIACLFLIFANINTLVANDWPQWRGPNRDGKLTNFKAPESWPASLEKRWSIDVGDGTSVPLVQGNTVFMHSRNGEDEYVSALNLDSGTIIWQDHYPAMYNVTPEAREFGKGPFSTPVLHDNILITFGISEVLTAYDPASGKQYWRKTFSDEYKRSHAYYGTSFSPLVAGDMLIVHVGGPGNGALMALDPGTGDEKWRWSGDGPAYASPVVAEIQGVRQIVTKTQQKIIGVELESGKLLWEVPYKVSYDNTISEVLIWRNLALASDFQKHFRAYRLQKKDDGWAVDTAWENKEASLYMSSPILYGDIFIGFSDKKRGQFFGLNPENGEVLWAGPGRLGDHASLVGSGDYLFALLPNGELQISTVSADGRQVLAKYAVAESAIYNTPVFVENGVLIKDFQKLTLWGW